VARGPPWLIRCVRSAADQSRRLRLLRERAAQRAHPSLETNCCVDTSLFGTSIHLMSFFDAERKRPLAKNVLAGIKGREHDFAVKWHLDAH